VDGDASRNTAMVFFSSSVRAPGESGGMDTPGAGVGGGAIVAGGAGGAVPGAAGAARGAAGHAAGRGGGMRGRGRASRREGEGGAERLREGVVGHGPGIPPAARSGYPRARAPWYARGVKHLHVATLAIASALVACGGGGSTAGTGGQGAGTTSTGTMTSSS